MTAPIVVWQGWPHAPAPLVAIAAARRTPGWRLVDDAGRQLPWSAARRGRETLRVLWQRALASALGAAARLVSGSQPAPAPVTTDAAGPVVLVLPVLPDLSHTFVYRETLALLRLHPDWRVVVLRRNAQAPVHPEARALLARATFLPRDGVTRAAWRALRWLARARGRDLFALYRAESGGSPHALLDKLALREAHHPGNAFLLADLLRPLRPRHLHVYGSTWPTNVAMGAARLLGAPFSISSYVDFEFEYSHRMLAAKFRDARFFRVVTAHCRRRLASVLPASATAPERVPVIYLGLDHADWREVAPLPGAGVLVSAARIVAKKGLRQVPPALALLRARGVACRWIVVGDGPELAQLRQDCAARGVADLVDFLGPQDNTVVRRELLGADLAVLPCVITADGERDGIPIFLVEAMALGVPVVTTPISGIPELVRDGETGYLAAAGDASALADALARALDNPAAARAVGAAGRAEVHRALDIDILARQLADHIAR
ncbi:MAG: glycosyltransferase family 4 protein [Planctomycetes bacterium]|nr:glycosyltransferase family 4 protein [Planctomycetota bacterium]